MAAILAVFDSALSHTGLMLFGQCQCRGEVPARDVRSLDDPRGGRTNRICAVHQPDLSQLSDSADELYQAETAKRRIDWLTSGVI